MSDRLSRLAAEFAAEIANHDWSDAPYRDDRAGHDRATDTKRPEKQLSEAVGYNGLSEVDTVRLNVVWVTAQVLLHSDPNLDLEEFAKRSGVPSAWLYNKRGQLAGGLEAGIRKRDGQVCRPGGWETT